MVMGQREQIHRGIGYSVRPIGDRYWRWEISPPLCVQGLQKASGTVEGDRHDAVIAARAIIERQTANTSYRI